MAFQIDLPILILRESGVMADGILEKGSSAFYLPTFDLDSSAQSYLFSDEWQHIFHKWSRQVKELAKTKEIATTADERPPTWNFLRSKQIAENKAAGKGRSSRMYETGGLPKVHRRAVEPENDVSNTNSQPKARAKFAFEATEDGELSVKKGWGGSYC